MPSYLTSATNFVNESIIAGHDDLDQMLIALEASCRAAKSLVRDLENQQHVVAAMAAAGQRVELIQEVLGLTGALESFVDSEREILMKHGVLPQVINHYIPECSSRFSRLQANFSPEQFKNDVLALQQTVCKTAETARSGAQRANLFQRLKGAGRLLFGGTVAVANGSAPIAALPVLPVIGALSVPIAVVSGAWGYDLMKTGGEKMLYGE